VELEALVDAFEAQLRDARGYSQNTVRGYLNDVRDFVAYLSRNSENSLAGIRLDNLRGWLFELTEQGLEKSSLARKSAAIRSFTGFLNAKGHLATDPGQRLRTPKSNRALPKVVSREALNTVFDLLGTKATEDNPIGLRDLAIVELLYASGARVSEIAGLNIEDIDFTRNLLRVIGRAISSAWFRSEVLLVMPSKLGCNSAGRLWSQTRVQERCC